MNATRRLVLKALPAALLMGSAHAQPMRLRFGWWEGVDAAGARLRPMLEKRLLERGFVVLYWAEAGWVRFFSKEPALRPTEFKKLKVFAWSGSLEQVELMKSIGYQPVV